MEGVPLVAQCISLNSTATCAMATRFDATVVLERKWWCIHGGAFMVVHSWWCIHIFVAVVRSFPDIPRTPLSFYIPQTPSTGIIATLNESAR
jgi:hypothetical protein